MSNRISEYKNRLTKAAFYIPFTIYFAAFTGMAVVLQQLIYKNEIKTDSSFSAIFSLLLQVALGFTILILLAAFVFVLISWLHFIYWKKKTGITLQVDTEKTGNRQYQSQAVHIILKPIIKPLFGFIKIRLLYDKKHFSGKFSLLEDSGKYFFNKSIEGTYHWALPEIKEYRLENAIIYFEDVFQFFSLAVSLPANNNFFSHPAAKPRKDEAVAPRKTEETNIRIDQMRKVEGEFLNYKNFENNDDVRRIVWKIYAKNKELVVRIPEIMDPYASHVYMYPSFYTSFHTAGNETIEIPFLNFYKTMTWSVYQSLVKQGFEVKYIPDYEVSKNISATNGQESVKHTISASRWHMSKDLKEFVQAKHASVVMLSSLSDVQQVKELTDRYGNDIRFIFIKLTDSFNQQNIADWLQWIFIKNEQEDADVYKRKWAVSFLKEKIKDNERKIEEVLGLRGVRADGGMDNE